MSSRFLTLPSFTTLLLLFFLWHVPTLLLFESQTFTTYAQTLTGPNVGNASTRTVPESLITLEQWEALQVESSQALLQNPDTYITHYGDADASRLLKIYRRVMTPP